MSFPFFPFVLSRALGWVVLFFFFFFLVVWVLYMPGCRHVDLKGNLIKAMMVLNWLNMLEVEKF